MALYVYSVRFLPERENTYDQLTCLSGLYTWLLTDIYIRTIQKEGNYVFAN